MDITPYIWEWNEDGIRRQVKIHVTRDGTDVQWDPRWPGDHLPWYDANGEFGDVAYRYEEADVATLGMPASHISSFDY